MSFQRSVFGLESLDLPIRQRAGVLGHLTCGFGRCQVRLEFCCRLFGRGEIGGVPTPVLYTIDEDWASSTNLNNNATIGGLGDATAVNIRTSESE